MAATSSQGEPKNIPSTLSRQAEESLTAQIDELFESLLPTKESETIRKQFVEKIDKILNEEWPGHEIKVHLFGSSVNLLGTTTSDVDICVTTPWTGLKNVYVLAKGLRKHGMQKIFCVPKAKVPIVRLWDPEFIDLRVRKLVMIIKYWAQRRILNDAAKGGTISTYTWTCMVLNFLQMRDPPILPVLHQIPSNREPVIVNGIDVTFYDDISLLRKFGETNTESVVISLRQGKFLTKEEKGWGETGRGWRLLSVEEPFNISRNLGNSADDTSVQGIIGEFQRAYNILYEKSSLEIVCQQYVFPVQQQRLTPTHFPYRQQLQRLKYRSQETQTNDSVTKFTLCNHQSQQQQQLQISHQNGSENVKNMSNYNNNQKQQQSQISHDNDLENVKNRQNITSSRFRDQQEPSEL
ncbi:1262_t:CDS:2 [Diversispora eburnea]|uniref:polynucleotide adenylyltransferase n=1 Tax=Diversispora eburnea TaxID=1213867 RepID=A0A9N9FB58_9GLOM|nr:1262_t:CDS:2 [Diversispora eburnea]